MMAADGLIRLLFLGFLGACLGQGLEDSACSWGIAEAASDTKEEAAFLQFYKGKRAPCPTPNTVNTVGLNDYGQLVVDTNLGDYTDNPTPFQVEALGTDVVSAAAGFKHSIFLMRNGTVFAAGRNRFGQLGVNAGIDDPNAVPMEVTSLGASVSSAAAGNAHSMFLTKKNKVYTAGWNRWGQLGVCNNSGVSPAPPNPIPLEVTDLGDTVVSMAGGDHHSIFLTKSGRVYTAGSNQYGQLGVTDNSGIATPNCVPMEVTSLGKNVKAVAAGYYHSIFLMNDGRVYTAGLNSFGQLGVATNAGNETANPTPILVESLGKKIVKVAAGGWHSIFLKESGKVYTAGQNRYGQLAVDDNAGVPSPFPPNPTPMQVASLGDSVSDMAGGTEHTIFLMKGGKVLTAGRNYLGQLGVANNTWTYKANPTPLKVFDTDVVSVAAGGDHSIFIKEN
eukprot:TRINITY_DN38524_c0_g1_i1.p1 TRINITY_DN38524_c0_g1~~TRINITY_DN38524_c0_g1_i1.p1  ORF type:complete len:447 (+),score=85.49 TRINITY_DN38524_c0_g1_i1:60-1400(+)